MKFSYCFSVRRKPVGFAGGDDLVVLDEEGAGGAIDVHPAGEVFAVEHRHEAGVLLVGVERCSR